MRTLKCTIQLKVCVLCQHFHKDHTFSRVDGQIENHTFLHEHVCTFNAFCKDGIMYIMHVYITQVYLTFL